MPTLPKYYVIKRDAKNPLWDKYIEWTNEKYNICMFWNICTYYGYDGEYSWNSHISLFNNSPTLITLDFWNECVNGKQEYKVGDIIDTTWLVAFPKGKTAEELGLKVGDLVVSLSDKYFRKWEILQIKTLCTDNSHFLTNWKNEWYRSTNFLSPLPTKLSTPKKPTKIAHTYITKKIRDDGI